MLVGLSVIVFAMRFGSAAMGLGGIIVLRCGFVMHIFGHRKSFR